MKFYWIFLFVNFIRSVIGSYILYPTLANFSVAVQICDSINASIVSINNLTEDAFIKNTYLNDASVTLGIWLAIYDFIGNETNVNYYTNQTLSFTNWNPGQPDTLTDYCVRYDKSLQKWADKTCSISYSVLCETSELAFTTSVLSTTTSVLSTATLAKQINGRYYSIIENADVNTYSFLIANFTISSQV